MLSLHFLNVGDGDAALIEDETEERSYRLLVDTGNGCPAREGGPCQTTAAEYLRRHGVEHIDDLVVTHLHMDHFGGLRDVLEMAEVDRVHAGFFPDSSAISLTPEPDAAKTVRGLFQCLELWRRDVEELRRRGIQLCPVTGGGRELELTPDLRAELLCVSPSECAVQRRIWDALLAGEDVPEGLVYWSSKFRNPGSLRVSLTYGGHRIELAGDCFADGWERQAKPCDLLKVPHHGDRRAMTAYAADRLCPRWAVVSCGGEYIPRKDRPSDLTLALLRSRGTRVWFTGPFAEHGAEGQEWESVEFVFFEDGNVITPDNRFGGWEVGNCDHNGNV